MACTDEQAGDAAGEEIAAEPHPMTPDEMLAAMALMPKHTTVEFSWSMLLGGKSIVSCMITATYTEWRGRGDTHLLAFEQAFRAWEKASK